VGFTKQITTGEEEEIDVLALWRVVWKAKYLIMFTTFVCAALAVAYALTATRIFRAEVVIAEAHDTGMGNGQGLSNQLGGLASLAGLDLTNGGQDHDAIAVLNSRRLIEEFIKRQNLLPMIFPRQGKNTTLWFAVKRFKDRIVTIREDKRTETTAVDIDWTDPQTAALWANGFVALANELVRTRALNESTRNIAYLTQQSSQTNVVDMQRAISDLIESEMKTLMLANGRTEYAFTVIDPAVTPEVRKSPQSVIIAIAGVAIGFFIGIVVAFIRERMARSRS
jgi:uncharacterized protein involved in exopolysaccharide biosynthesis